MTTLSFAGRADQNRVDARVINRELGNVLDWITCNKLAVNTDKSSFMIFSYIRVVHIGNLYVGVSELNQMQSMHLDSRFVYII